MSKIPAHYKNKGDLTKGSIISHLMRLSVPMTWGILTIISIQLVDTYFISLLGTNELAGVSFTFPVTMILSHLVFGINIAISSVVARLIGEKQMGDVRRIAAHGIMLAMASSTFFAVLCYIFMEPLFRLLGADAQTLPVIWSYMPLWLLSSIVIAVHASGNSVMRSAGHAMYPAITMTLVAILNLILDPILIFGLLGAPEMGVEGAALATLLANLFAGLIAFYLLAFRMKLICLNGLNLSTIRDSMRRMVVIAIPAGIGNIIQPLTGAVMTALVATHGTQAVAAFGIASRVEAFALLFVIGLALGMGPIIGQNWGAGNFSRVYKTINKAITLNLIWSGSVAVILGLFAYPIAGVFSEDPKVVEITALFFWVVPFSFAFGNLVNGWAAAFNAIGLPKRAFFMIAVKAFGLSIPGVIIGNYFFGIPGIFAAVALTNVISGVFFHFYSKSSCAREEAACA